MGIAFLPINIEVALPDEQKLQDFFEENQLQEFDDGYEENVIHWDKCPVLGKLQGDEWHDQSKLRHLINYRNNKTGEKQTYYRDIDKIFPEIPFMLNQLPILEFSMVTMLRQRQEVPCHIDSQMTEVNLDLSEVSVEMEPRRYNILLTKHEYKSFYVSEFEGSEKFYPTLTKERPCHLISEKMHWHGADWDGPGKIMLAILAVLDRPKHFKMIKDNYELFKDNGVIEF